MTALREKIASAKAEEKVLRAAKVSLSAVMTCKEIHTAMKDLQAKKAEYLDRLNLLRTGNVKPILPEEKAQAEQDWKQWNHKSHIRKKICMELWSMLTEQLPEGKTAENLWVRDAFLTALTNLGRARFGG